MPNVLLAYAHDDAKLTAFAALLQRSDAGSVRPVEAGAGDDRGRGLEREPLLLLPDRSWRGGASALAAIRCWAKLMAMNYRAAELSARHRAMLDFRGEADGGFASHEGRPRRRCAKAGVRRARHLGHQRGRRLLQHIEPRMQRRRVRYAAGRAISQPVTTLILAVIARSGSDGASKGLITRSLWIASLRSQ